MTDTAIAARRMTIEEFFEWQAGQDRLYELVDGIPVLPIKSMTGASDAHDRITVNAIISLGVQLRGKRCRVSTEAKAVRTGLSTTRRPDLSIECGSPARTSTSVDKATVVVEVLSPSTMRIDRFQKLNEYQHTDGIDVILLVDTERPLVIVYRRAGPAWTIAEVSGLDGVIELPEIDARLPLADLYDGSTFPTPEPAR